MPENPSLCLSCGLCCDGTLFRDVELQPGDDARALIAHGLPVEHLRRKSRFPQPCAALGEGCQCALYEHRPLRCRQFDCAQLMAVAQGTTSRAAALRRIQRARAAADEVRRLLTVLGEANPHRALLSRFQRLQRRFEAGGQSHPATALWAQAAAAMHRLNLILSRDFIPHAAQGRAGRPASNSERR